ncbi:Prenylcysteine oxidase [Xylariaceae sp. FL0016]|nr:Prenylcysteine oxidase [Xylariaceae sp. FL0016]
MLFKRFLNLSWLYPYVQLDPAADAVDVAESNNVKQVAIIGAGAAGSSAAYHLHKFAEQEGIAINLTVFEKTERIGGRTLTVNVYDNPLDPVELGASIFVEVNHILYNASNEFGLALKDPGSDEDGLLGIWDGKKFVYSQDSASSGWWNLAKLFWRYGTAPYYTKQLVDKTVATFLRLYEAPNFPFKSLTERTIDLGLVKITGLTGQQFLAENKLDGAFAHDIVQASTRVNYASNLEYIHGLGTMVAMAPEGAVAVAGGNWRIFAKMVETSCASLYLNTSVSSISTESSKNTSFRREKYRIRTSKGQENAKAEAHPMAFDDVVIATPYQFSDISHADDLLQQPIDDIPYATLHVSLFASPFRFSPAFFNLDAGAVIPISVLSTLGTNDAPQSGDEGVGSAGFFSATQVKVVTNPKTLSTEYVYKIFSPHKVTPEFLSRLLGAEVPETFTRPHDVAQESNETAVEPISWYHATVFRPYPQKLPRVTFQDPILRDGLYYTSGIESFISTMETSALMGMNVARLIVDDYLEASRNDTEEVPVLVEDSEPAQIVLAGETETLEKEREHPVAAQVEL